MDQLKKIAEAFQCPGKYLGEEPFGSGHINDTYKAFYNENGREVHYIRQRMNHQVFKDVPALMENIGRVTRHQHEKFEAAGEKNPERRVMTLVPAQDGKDFYQDVDGNFWRTYVFIEGAAGIDVVESPSQAFEAARAFGEFQCQLVDFPMRLHETIPNFHNTRFRYDTLIQSIEADEFNRASDVKAEIDFATAREELVDTVSDLFASGELPERVAHNDAKLNNVLIDNATGKGVCVIDLDTVMPGSVLYDFGDIVRTASNPAAEDELDPSKVGVDIVYFEALVNGYLETASGFLVPRERELLPMSGQFVAFETGLRFLTDYLQGDIYFKTHRERQNVDRCRKQFAMLQSMEARMDAMHKIVENC